MVKIPNPKGQGWICADSIETVEKEQKHIRELMYSMVLVGCKCNRWSVTLPLIPNQRCNRCGYSLVLITGSDDDERFW